MPGTQAIFNIKLKSKNKNLHMKLRQIRGI